MQADYTVEKRFKHPSSQRTVLLDAVFVLIGLFHFPSQLKQLYMHRSHATNLQVQAKAVKSCAQLLVNCIIPRQCHPCYYYLLTVCA